jgi:hypothetical protein
MVKKLRLATLGAAVSSVKPAKGYDFGPSRTKKNGSSETTKQGGDTDPSLPSSSQSSDETLLLTRNTDQLYAPKETFDCTMEDGCVPCAYKIGCFDVALDKEFVKATPNQRPEQCPRSSTSSSNRDDDETTETTQKTDDKKNNNNNNCDDDGVMGFRRGMSILTVGDGDFSFSLGLARKLMQEKRKEGNNDETSKMELARQLLQQQQQRGNNDDDETTTKKTFLVATSYESESTLRTVYPDFEETLRELEELGVHVAYNVDATRILETLSLPEEKSLEKKKRRRRFHRICWNFPCTAIGSGQDGQNTAMEDNKELVRNFVENSRSVLTDKGDGELYICHKTKPPFNQWNLEEVALEKQQKQKPQTKKNDGGVKTLRRPLLYYSGRIVLDRFLLPPYTPRKALDKKSFPCHDACFYVFAQEQSAAASTKKKKKKRLFLPTIPRNEKTNSEGGDNTSSSTTLIKIEPELIRLIRRKHMKTIKPGNKRKWNAKHDKTTKESSGSTKGRGGSTKERGGSTKGRSSFDLQRF